MNTMTEPETLKQITEDRDKLRAQLLIITNAYRDIMKNGAGRFINNPSFAPQLTWGITYGMNQHFQLLNQCELFLIPPVPDPLPQ